MGIIYRVKKLLGYNINQLDGRIHKKNSQKIISNYIANHTIKKLQIGAQGSPINNWLNVDILPKTKDTAYMDATKKFPIASNTFDFMFAEHMIEHISFDDAQFMLKECYRILKPNGVIRLATPNLDTMIKLLQDPSNPKHIEYISYYVKKFYGPNYPNLPALQINKLFYGFHHCFIHNYESLKFILETAGFTNIVKCSVGISKHDELNNIEHHATILGKQNNEIETFIIEAQK